MGSEFFFFFFMRKEGRTNMTKVIVTSRNFAKASRNNIVGTYDTVRKTAKKIMTRHLQFLETKKKNGLYFIMHRLALSGSLDTQHL